jgi:hypothetical protein
VVGTNWEAAMSSRREVAASNLTRSGRSVARRLRCQNIPLDYCGHGVETLVGHGAIRSHRSIWERVSSEYPDHHRILSATALHHPPA